MSLINDRIADNLSVIQSKIEDACRRAGRHPDEVTVIGVTKQRSVEEINAVVQAGIRSIGENRVEEAVDKIPRVMATVPSSSLQWHMIGHVQSRKARQVVQYFDVVHSLDSLKLGRRYDEFARQASKSLRVLLEINISGEVAKYGIGAHQWQTSTTQRQDLWTLISELQKLERVNIIGLMTMAPYTGNETIIRSTFAGLRTLRDALCTDFAQLDLHELSMGMTNDYAIAVEEGATMVRIGRAIFGDVTG